MCDDPNAVTSTLTIVARDYQHLLRIGHVIDHVTQHAHQRC